MSDAPAAPVTESGVPPATQDNLAQEGSGFKVFAGNLAYTTTDDGLKAFFAPVQSEILSAQVIMRGTRSAGYGFVALSSAEAAKMAVDTLDKKELDGRTVVVEIAKPTDQKDQEKKEKRAKRRPGRRGGRTVPGEVSEAEAAGDRLPEESTSAANDATNAPKKRKKSNRKNKPRSEPGEASADATPAPADGEAPKKASRPHRVKAPRPPRPEGQDPVGEPSKSMLFVANLGFSVDDEALSNLFTEAGINVVSARIVRRRWGHPRKSKGYGFVDVGGEAEQQKAIQLLEGKDVGGRNIAVKVAVNSPHEDIGEAKPDAAEERTAAA